jgi:hypothetical protein
LESPALQQQHEEKKIPKDYVAEEELLQELRLELYDE